MKTFTLTAHSITVGLRVQEDARPHVGLGVPGKHQTALWVVLAEEEWKGRVIPRKLERTSVLRIPPIKKERSEGTILLAPEMDDHRFLVKADNASDALVLADIRGKEGASALWTMARKAPQPCPMRGMNGATHPSCPMCSVRFENGRHPDRGTAMDHGPFPPTGISIIKKGWIRYKGKHPTFPRIKEPPWAQIFLLHMQPGAIFRVDRGYEKGAANERVVRWTGEQLELGSAEQLEPGDMPALTTRPETPEDNVHVHPSPAHAQ